MPGRSGSVPARGGQRSQLGEAGEQSVHERTGPVPRTRVDDQARGLVDHQYLVVVVHDRVADRQVGPRSLGGRPLRALDTELLARPHRHAPAADHLPVEPDPAGPDQLVDGRPRQVGEQRHRPVDPDPREGHRHRHHQRVHRAGGRRSSETTSRPQPTTMQASATLKVGQKWRATKSTTAPPRKSRSTRLPSAPPRISP